MQNDSFREFIERVRAAIDIIQVIGERIELDKSYKARCPFHDDHDPSFSVNTKGQYFHCFGCGVGGDVIRFLELYEKRPFFEVLCELAQKAGIPLPAGDVWSGTELEAHQSRHEILRHTAQFYRNSMTEDAGEYLTGIRGFNDNLIDRFMIGYANGGLRQHLIEERGFSVDDCVAAGVLKKADDGKVKDYFYNRIIFPNIRHGRVVHLTGRSLGDHEPRYLHVPGPMEFLYNEDALFEDHVLICEGIPDCLSAIQAGFPAVGVLGTHQFNASHVERFRRVRHVYLCLDPDRAGQNATGRIAALIPDKAILVQMPIGGDLNEYLLHQTPDDLRHLMDEGRPYLDSEIDRLKSIPENTRLPEIQKFLPVLASLDEFTRNHMIDKIRKEFKLSKNTIESGIIQSQPVSEAIIPDPPTYTSEEKEQAESLLKDPNLLERLGEATERLGCVGEENNKVTLYLALTSRILDSPISLIVKGDSSGGKSLLVDTIQRLFPPEEVLAFTTLTPKALYHRKNDLAHKVLIIFERPGAEGSDYSIRSLQSEKKLIISIPIKDPDTEQWVTEDHEIAGPVAYIETTTRSHLHPENETRCFEIFIDDSMEQTERILTLQRNRYCGSGDTKSDDFRPWIVAQQLLKPYPVIIPYVKLIEFPSVQLRVRRDFPRFLTLIEVSAILHQFQREKKTVNGIEHLVANIEDYGIAYNLASVILQQIIMQVSPKAERLAKAIKESIGENLQTELTLRQIVERTKWDIKTTRKYLNECVRSGLIDKDDSKKSHFYRFIRLPDSGDSLLLDPVSLEEKWAGHNRSNEGKLIQMGFGQINPLDYNEIPQSVQSVQGNSR